MKEEKKELEWVSLRLAYDPEKDTVLMQADDRDTFAKATGLLMRISLQTTKDILINESKKEENEK